MSVINEIIAPPPTVTFAFFAYFYIVLIMLFVFFRVCVFFLQESVPDTPKKGFKKLFGKTKDSVGGDDDHDALLTNSDYDEIVSKKKNSFFNSIFQYCQKLANWIVSTT